MTTRRSPARHAAAPAAGRTRRDPLTGPAEPGDGGGYQPAMTPAPVRPPKGAFGTRTQETWLRDGQMQFDYLINHGLQPGDRMLEIGCGNLSAGHLFIDYLSAGNYYGIDSSPDALIGAQRTVTEFGLQAKLPHLTLVSDLTLGFLPASRFTVVHAHNAFCHVSNEVIAECLAHVSRVMTLDAIFDFTFDRTDGAGQQMCRGDFYYRSDALISLAGSYGLDAELMKDWDQFGHPQSKLRVIRRSSRPGRQYG